MVYQYENAITYTVYQESDSIMGFVCVLLISVCQNGLPSLRGLEEYNEQLDGQYLQDIYRLRQNSTP